MKGEKFDPVNLGNNAEFFDWMPMSAPRVLFVVDGGPEIGGGHVMRALTLAKALQEKARSSFLAPAFVAGLLDRFAGGEVGRIAAGSAEPARLADAAVQAAAGFDAVVFDHFRLAAPEHQRIAGGRASLAIDDLADRPLGADLILDPTPGRSEADYAGCVMAGAKLLPGAAYALVGAPFAEAREAALARRVRAGEAGRVLVSLGLTDVGGITARVVDRLLPRLGEAQMDMVLGPAAPSHATLERLVARDQRVSLHVETDAMAELCAQADLAVGAGGSSTWERCTVGLPTVTLILVDNQAAGAQALAAKGAGEVVDARATDFEAAFDRAFTGLMRSPARRIRMGRAAAALCDGQGGRRVAETFLQLIAERRR